MTTQRATRTRRTRAAGFILTLAGAALALGAMAMPANAEDAPKVFGAGYDAYLKAAHRGTVATNQNDTCPNVTNISGETGWHFVLDGNERDFVTVDVAFDLGNGVVQYTGLTPKAADDPTFDVTKNFVADPNLKHAYVYTPSTGTLADAAAQLNPDGAYTDFQLSHICAGAGTTTTESTTTTTEGTTTTTEGTTTTEQAPTTSETVLGSTVTQGPSTSATVKGVVIDRQLPRTGAGMTEVMTYAAVMLLAAGMALLAVSKRNLSAHR